MRALRTALLTVAALLCLTLLPVAAHAGVAPADKPQPNPRTVKVAKGPASFTGTLKWGSAYAYDVSGTLRDRCPANKRRVSFQVDATYANGESSEGVRVLSKKGCGDTDNVFSSGLGPVPKDPQYKVRTIAVRVCVLNTRNKPVDCGVRRFANPKR